MVVVPVIIASTIVCIGFLILSGIFLRYEKLNMSSMNLIPNKSSIPKLFFGLIIGTAIVGLMLLVLFTMTNLDIQRDENQSIMLFIKASLVFVPLALMEEILFRGYPFFRLSQLINIRWVIFLTSILFALYHYNGSSNIYSLFIGPGIWGVVYGVAAYLSNSIAVPLGIHISANVLQALFALKSDYVPMWDVIINKDISNTITPDHLGIIMQIILLVISIIILEFSIRKKK